MHFRAQAEGASCIHNNVIARLKNVVDKNGLSLPRPEAEGGERRQAAEGRFGPGSPGSRKTAHRIRKRLRKPCQPSCRPRAGFLAPYPQLRVSNVPDHSENPGGGPHRVRRWHRYRSTRRQRPLRWKLARVTATKARRRLDALVDAVGQSHQPVQITAQRGDVVLLPQEDGGSIQETLPMVSIPHHRPMRLWWGTCAVPAPGPSPARTGLVDQMLNHEPIVKALAAALSHGPCHHWGLIACDRALGCR